jgi:MoxR-like ATPase
MESQNFWQEYIGAVATQLVGREQEVKQIYHAVGSENGKIVFILGEGGIGKTFLIRQILTYCSPGSRWSQDDMLSASDVVDFYNTPTHVLEGLTSAIRDSLGGIGFEGFNQRLRDFVQTKYDLRGQGQAIEQSRGILLEQFLEDFRRLADQKSNIITSYRTLFQK